jgi:hypothetical protein
MKAFWDIYGIPLLIAAVTFFGLVAALWGGPAWRWASWIALAAPLAIIALRVLRPRA